MIDINVHGTTFTARSVVFSSQYDPFVTFEVYSDGGGGATFYIRSIDDAERIAQAALELLKNTEKLVSDFGAGVKDPTND